MIINDIQILIGYIEDHLLEKIDTDEFPVLKNQTSSDIQRAFMLIFGISIAEYIRYRRLSLAAEEIIQSKKKIYEVAEKYFYDSQEGFSRAFKDFHGLSPLEARKKNQAKYFSKFKVSFSKSGGNKNSFRITEIDEIKVLCIKKKQKSPHKSYEKLKKEWSDFREDSIQNGLIDNLTSRIPANPRFNGLLGIISTNEIDTGSLLYSIGVEYDGKPLTDSNFEIITIPPQKYAVFSGEGIIPDTFMDMHKEIITEFIPQSKIYKYKKGYEFELYHSIPERGKIMSYEVWFPVTEMKLK